MIDLKTVVYVNQVNLGRLSANTTVNMSSVDIYALLCKPLRLDPCPLSSRNASTRAVAALLTDVSTGEKLEHAVKEFTDFVQDPSNMPLTSKRHRKTIYNSLFN